MSGFVFVHVGAGAWIVGVLLYGMVAPGGYAALMQEDRVVEWTTVWLFLFAGGARLHRALRQKRLFDGLVALFCLFVAGEEFSWGQRIIGYHAPEFFLENNFQQEANVHNLPQSFLQPKWVLIMALAGYGVGLPLLARYTRTRHVADLAGATPPPNALVPWFAAAILMLVWYPLEYTGEWIEAFSGALFVLGSGIRMSHCGIITVTAVLLSTATTVWGLVQQQQHQPGVACADKEVRSLVSDIVGNSAATPRLWNMRRLHKRLWSSIGDGYVMAEHLRGFNAVSCGDAADRRVETRRKYGLDPWGSPYWIEITRAEGGHRLLTVYSFGPNRRRDRSGDDIRASHRYVISD